MMNIMSFTARALLLIILAANTGCDYGADRLPGSWKSVSVKNPSPFFKIALAEYKEGAITLDLYPDKRFIWADSLQNMQIKGSFEVKGDKILLRLNKDDEKIALGFSAGKKRLVIKTDDYFTFTFVRYDRQ